MTDVVVVGGGVIGLSLAWELASEGAEVTLIERGQPGAEASWAGAGILLPGNPNLSHASESGLRALSHTLWPTWSQRLRDDTGIDNGFSVCGGLQVRLDGQPNDIEDEITFWQSEGVAVEPLTPQQAMQLEQRLSPRCTSAYRLPELGQVRSPRHLKALLAAATAIGVRLQTGCSVTGFDLHNDRVESVLTSNGEFHAGRFCVCGGAWSRQILETAGCDVPVDPVRGQIVQLSSLPLPFRHVIQNGSRYLVPRPDGVILVGSTEERVGFEKRNTPEAVAGLLQFATLLVPALSSATFVRAWSGLRPGSPDGLPLLGRVGRIENLFVATGHFRSGLQLSPGTAVVLRQLLLEQEPAIPTTGFSPEAAVALTK